MKIMTSFTAALSIFLVTTPLITTSLQAHTTEMCNYEMDYDLTIEDSALSFTQESGKNITIDQDNQLFVNGNKKQLDSQQQQLIDDYADGIRDLIPEVTALATEGVNLGVEAATMALSILLDGSDPDIEHFSGKLNQLAQNITLKLDANHFSSKKLEEAFDSEFEAEIETIVEEAVTEITPKLISKVITAAMSGEEGTISDIEQRAEFLEHEIEDYVEPRAEALEARADELCDSIGNLDALETKMVESGLEMMDMIDKGQGNHKDKSDRYKFKFSD